MCVYHTKESYHSIIYCTPNIDVIIIIIILTLIFCISILIIGAKINHIHSKKEYVWRKHLRVIKFYNNRNEVAHQLKMVIN